MITNLPANVAVATTYVVTFEGWADANVTGDTLNGLVTVEQAGASHTFPVEELPGLIAALQAAAAGLTPTPDKPSDLPAFVIDGEGDHWYRDADADTYTLGNNPDDGWRAPRSDSLLAAQTLDAIRERHGIKGEG